VRKFALRLIVQRAALALGTLLVASFLIFWLIEWLPGDVATRSAPRGADPATIQTLREELGLDRPGLVRYGDWLAGFVTGDWGESLVARVPVTDTLVPKLVNTLVLAGAALLLYLPLSVLTGVLTAVFRHRRWSTAVSVLVLLGTAIPEFVTAIFLLVVFTVSLQWFTPLADIGNANSLGELVQVMALPVLTLVIAMTAYAVRMLQGSLVDVLDSDYVRMARLRGLPPWRIIFRHALPQAVGPMARVTVLNLAWVVGGVVVVEQIFEYPGMGRLLVESIQLLDTPMIAAITLILASTYILANVAADLLAALFNPKLRGDTR
jgi:peptide/nickel transport system permease protein